MPDYLPLILAAFGAIAVLLAFWWGILWSLQRATRRMENIVALRGKRFTDLTPEEKELWGESFTSLGESLRKEGRRSSATPLSRSSSR